MVFRGLRITGLVARTVTRNVRVKDLLSAGVSRMPSVPPSSTVTVMMLVPVFPRVGVKVRLVLGLGEK